MKNLALAYPISLFNDDFSIAYVLINLIYLR